MIEEHENYNKSVIIVVLSDKTTYNKSIPILKWHEIREVKECFYGTIDFKETAGLEKFSLPQTANFKRGYYENTAYFNFDENEEYKQFFETTKDVERILQNLILASGQKIVPEKTLIVFDEVQDCPKVINSMKYFCENAPQYHIACAGSLLGIALAKPSSFPVGKVNFMQIDPMTFTEFLMANGDENLVGYMFCIADAGDTV